MKSILFFLTLISAPAFADQLRCLCTGANFREEMTCDQFREPGHCTFEDRLENQSIIWQKDFVATAQGIVFSWATNGVRQEATIKPGAPFDFQYYGDADTYTMTCEYTN